MTTAPPHLPNRTRSASAAPEHELRRLNRALETLTRATEALIRATDEQQLLNEVCRIVVEVGGYVFAWVGYAQHDDERSIWPVARYGAEEGYLARARIGWGDDERGMGPAGEAIRTGLPQVVYPSDRSFAPWSAEALQRGFRATVALPLRVEGQVIGMINLYAADPVPLDPNELSLMANLAQNVAYGIGMQRIQFERRRAERELKESEGRYRSLVELSPDAILVHTQGIIIFSNSAADQLFRVTPTTPLVGKRMGDLIQTDEAAGYPDFSADEPPSGVVEERLSRLDGSFFIAEVTAAPVVFHGVHARQVVIRDITERKQVQEQLVQTAKLATLGEMAAGMAHELSQPINIIRMAAEGALLMIERGKASQEYQVKQFSLMAGQAGRMAEIIDHIRIFSRKDAGEVTMFDARNSARLATELMASQMKSAEIDMIVRLPNRPCPVLGRPVQLEQVIINLLANAHDAILAQRKITGRQPRGQVTMEASLLGGSSVRIAVTDNGTGINPTHLDRIFEPFFTTKEVGSGTGLGLSVSFGIISAMGGRLEAQNLRPTGAEFLITLRLAEEIDTVAEADPTEDADDRPNDSSSPSHHVLVVDDERHAVDTMSAYLGELGYRVSRARSGNAALALFRHDPADIVVTDVRMPDGDGEQLLGRLRQLAPGLPVVMVTGHMGATDHFEDDAAAHRLVVLKKPISLATLAETIEQLLRKG